MVTSTEFRAALKALGWKQSDLEQRIKVHPNTISAWATGRVKVPGPIVAYLDLAQRVHAVMLR